LRAMSLPISRRASADNHIGKETPGLPPSGDRKKSFMLEQSLAEASMLADAPRAHPLVTEPDEMPSSTPGSTENPESTAKHTSSPSQLGTAGHKQAFSDDRAPSSLPVTPSRLRSRSPHMDFSISMPPAAVLGGEWNGPFSHRPEVWRPEAQAPPTPEGWDLSGDETPDGLRAARRQLAQPPPTEWDVPFELECDPGFEGDHVTSGSGMTAVDRADGPRRRSWSTRIKDMLRTKKKIIRYILLSDPKVPIFLRLLSLASVTVSLGECLFG
jgi:hypothetical protein